MKKVLLFLLFFVNLQLVISHKFLSVSGNTANAQNMSWETLPDVTVSANYTDCPNGCGYRSYPKDIESHLENTCPNRLIECEKCHSTYQACKANQHSCESGYTTCERCGKEVPKEDLENHKLSCVGNNDKNSEKNICPNCEQPYYGDISNHSCPPEIAVYICNKCKQIITAISKEELDVKIKQHNQKDCKPKPKPHGGGGGGGGGGVLPPVIPPITPPNNDPKPSDDKKEIKPGDTLPKLDEKKVKKIAQMVIKALKKGMQCNVALVEYLKEAYGEEFAKQFEAITSDNKWSAIYANEIIKIMQNDSNWKRIPKNDLQKWLRLAQEYANMGYIVVGTLKNSSGHGHVCMIMQGSLTQGKSYGWNGANERLGYYVPGAVMDGGAHAHFYDKNLGFSFGYNDGVTPDKNGVIHPYKNNRKNVEFYYYDNVETE